MGRSRRLLLAALPKVALSRTTGVLSRLPIPRLLRSPLYGTYAWRYGCELSEVAQPLADYHTFAAFFQRALRAGARPVAQTPLLWPADGRIIAAGAIHDGRIPQIKGLDYAVAELVADVELACRLEGGSHAAVYLAPGDYHRVHAPFAVRIEHHAHIPGGLLPVNPGAVRSVPRLLARNERHVLAGQTAGGRAAAVVLVAALNVSDTTITCPVPGDVLAGVEIARFGLGSTVIALLGPGAPAFAEVPPGTAVRACAAASAHSGHGA